MKIDEKILVYFVAIALSSLIGFTVGFLAGSRDRDIINKFNDTDEVHSEIVQKDYKYCPYCGEYIKSED